MNIEHPSPEALQRYFDAELPAEELPQVQAHLAACSECSAQLGALTRLHDFIAMAATDSEQQGDFERMFANIERGIEAASPIIAVEPARAADSKSAAPVTNLLHPKLRRLSNAVPALGAVALAAAALLMVYRADPPQSGGSEESYEVTAAGGHSEIVEVDFGTNAGTVFDISLADGSSSPVVWIDDDDEDDDQADHENANQE